MTNLTSFIELQNKRALMMEACYELLQFLTLPANGARLLMIVIFILMGWLISFLTVLLVCHLLPLSNRKPNKAVFFAAFQEKIKQTFSNQSEQTFRTIMVGTNRVLQNNTEEPTVFLMLVPHGAMPTASRLVTLLIHCTLVAYQLPSSQHHVQPLITDGHQYTSHGDEWPFFYHVKRQLRFNGVAAVFAFESLHPQVVRTVQHLLPQIFSPCPQSVLILVVDLRNRFTEYQKRNLSANFLGRAFLQDQFGPYFDQSELADTIRCLGSRCVLVNPEPNIT